MYKYIVIYCTTIALFASGMRPDGNWDWIDNCDSEPCDSIRSICKATYRSYTCQCITGFQKRGSSTICIDVDECRTSNSCDLTTTTCSNNEGSYSCECKAGFKRNSLNNFLCDDIDECTAKLHSCNLTTSTCLNNNGGYSCKCNNGYEHRRVGDMVCFDVDECRTSNSCDLTTTTCSNNEGSYSCECKAGFRRNSLNNFLCDDVDECSTSNSCDLTTTTCSNNEGSYGCECKAGFKRNSLKSFVCDDINECQTNSHKCDLSTTNCTNTEGSYRCDCKTGFDKHHVNDTSCIDINECETLVYNKISTNCSNTIGSYKLLCKEGFHKRNIGDVCEDINECLDIEKYDSQVSCINTEGSFSLQCPFVHYLDKDGEKYTCKVSSSNVGKITGGILSVVALLTIAIVALFLWKRKIRQRSEKNKNCLEEQESQTKTYVNVFEKKSDSKILVRHFSERTKGLSDVNNGYEEEFQKATSIANQFSTSYAQQSGVKMKNRFQNICPYDNTRVILKNTGEMFSDYINASHIKVLENLTSVIAAQGPTKETVNDFWRMITEQHVNVIVMMTELVENNKDKCFPYWPEQQGDEMEFGNILINNSSVITWNLFLRRQLKIRNKNDGSTRVVTQWQYLAWPDHGVPTDVQSFLRFRNNVRASMDKSGKTLIHCSSGVGRTGCFIAIDVLLEEAATKGSVDVVSCGRKLNQQRFQLIQSKEQYCFIYLALKVAFKESNIFIPAPIFHKHYLEMLENKKHGESKLVLEFEKLLKETFQEMKSNLYSKEITTPGDKWKVYSDEAIQSDNFMYATFPSESDVEMFWEISEQRANVIVLLDPTKESQKTFLPTHEKSMNCQKFKINLTNTLDLGVFHKDTITITSYACVKITGNSKESFERQFTVFRVYVNNSEFLTRELLTELRNQIYLVSNQSPNRTTSTFVLSRDNLKLASFYVACCKLFEQMESLKEVSVYNTVLDLHRGMDQPVFTLTQYKKLYKILDKEVTSKNFI